MAEGGVVDMQSLQELFREGLGAQKKAENDEFPTPEELKSCVVKGLRCLEQATQMTNQLALFSTNESIEDVATADLKYLLLPALLGDLTLQVSDGNRLELIQKARVYFTDYLQRCRSYAITTEDLPPQRDHTPSACGPAPPPQKTYEELAAERTAKIAKLKQQKELERKLKELTVRVELSLVSARHPVEEEVLRDHALTLLHVWVLRCQDHVRSLDQEAELLEGMERRRGGGGANGWEATLPEPETAKKPMKPIVITKEMLKSKVFGAGYPSLPTMSVEEFYEQKYKEDIEQRHKEEVSAVRLFDDTMVGGARGRKDREAEEEEGGEGKEEDEDSEEALKKARDWDDFKDDNRTGWGNKRNMG